MKFVLILSGVGLCKLDCSLGLRNSYSQTAACSNPWTKEGLSERIPGWRSREFEIADVVSEA